MYFVILFTRQCFKVVGDRLWLIGLPATLSFFKLFDFELIYRVLNKLKVMRGYIMFFLLLVAILACSNLSFGSEKKDSRFCFGTAPACSNLSFGSEKKIKDNFDYVKNTKKCLAIKKEYNKVADQSLKESAEKIGELYFLGTIHQCWKNTRACKKEGYKLSKTYSILHTLYPLHNLSKTKIEKGLYKAIKMRVDIDLHDTDFAFVCTNKYK